MADSANIQQNLQEIHGRYARRLLCQQLIPGLFWGAVAALLVSLFAQTSEMSGFWNSKTLKILIVFGGGILALLTLGTGALSVYGLAKHFDDELELGDRLSTAFALQERSGTDPMVALVLEDAGQAFESSSYREALPQPSAGKFLGAVVVSILALWMSAETGVIDGKPKLQDETRRELRRQAKMLDDSFLLEGIELTEDEKHRFEQIRQMIETLQLEDKSISRKEMLARFSREIEGLEDMENSSDALKGMLEQLKEMKDAVAGRMLVQKQIEEIEQQHTELAVVDEKTGETLKAQEIEVMEVQEERRRQQEEIAIEMKKVAEEEKKDEEVSKWVVDEGEIAEEGDGATTTKKKARVVASYEDLVKAAEKKDIRKMIFTAAADSTRKTESYREVYANYNRAFQSMLYQGNLSLGTRQYLRRYFRSIEPKKEEEKKAGNPEG
ncbi:MAG: hypothetical protein QGF00_08860 [Planctomycetota bacterium]|jgi:hypothetical protein|nr:hypothetical protein [Planctomycetota bacterium]MDP7249696.1 hypothetical protein [Planctomycetota bacterium]